MIERATVEGWLREMELRYEVLELGEEAPQYAWALNYFANFTSVVAQRGVARDHLYLQTVVQTSPEHADVLRELTADVRDRFVFDLKIALAQQPLGHQVEYDPNAAGVPLRVTLALNMVEEAPQYSGFLRRNHQLQSGALLTAYMFQKLHRFREW